MRRERATGTVVRADGRRYTRREAITLLGLGTLALDRVSLAGETGHSYQLRMRHRPPASSGGGDLLAFSDLTDHGWLQMPANGSGTDFGNYRTLGVSGRRVSGVNNLLVTQSGSGLFVGAYAPCEMSDPGTGYSTTRTSAARLSVVTNWGLNAAGNAPFDPYEGKFAKSYNAAGSQVDLLSPTDTSLAADCAFHNGRFYLMNQQAYGNYEPRWNGCGFVLTTRGATGQSFGPFRTEQGVAADVNGSETPLTATAPNRGPRRGAVLAVHPNGGMLIGGSNGATQQGAGNIGVSMSGRATWPTEADTFGFGTLRVNDGSTQGGVAGIGSGQVSGRSTDVIMTEIYVAHYSMASYLASDGSVPGGQTMWSMERPPYSGNPGSIPYYFCHGMSCSDPFISEPPTQINPEVNGNVGSFTTSDGMSGMCWIGGSKQGVLFLGTVATGHEFYQTRACDVQGTGNRYYRGVQEAYRNIPNTNDVAMLTFAAKAYVNLVRIRYVDPGAASQALSVSVTGNDITVNLATNGAGAITTTMGDIKTAVEANGPANALVTVTGHGLTTVVPAMPYANLAGGPRYCPRHGASIPEYVWNTGPVTSQWNPFIACYDPDELEARAASGNIQYWTPQPVWFEYLSTDLLPAAQLPAFGSAWFEPVSRKLYVLSCMIDAETNPGASLPAIRVYTAAGTS